MMKNSQTNNYEIDLTELIQIVWEGKWKIAAAVVISFIVMISYQSNQIKNFTVKTDIKSLAVTFGSYYLVFLTVVPFSHFLTVIIKHRPMGSTLPNPFIKCLG